jgi:excisionase family DNA binding protein
MRWFEATDRLPPFKAVPGPGVTRYSCICSGQRSASLRSFGGQFMPSTLLGSGTLLVDDDLRAEAQGLARRVHDRVTVGLRLELDDGSSVELPTDLARFVSNVLSGVTRGPVSVQTLPEDLTTTTAAEMLAVSRPTLMKWVRLGELPSHKVGSHTRLKTQDVIEFRARLRARREAAFGALRAWDEQLDAAVGSSQ